MTPTCASWFPLPGLPASPLWAEVRSRLRNALFLHLDLWPWGQVSDPPTQALMVRGSRRLPDSGQPPFDRHEADRAAFRHEPVLLREALEFLQPAPGKLFLDATLGGGGHSAALLAAGADVIGFDQDADAIESARRRLADHEDHFVALNMNFRHFGSVLEEAGVRGVDGILADIGVSSHQLDTASRGFSLQHDGPLDMRMNPDSEITAADLVNHRAEAELGRIFRDYGEEPHWRRAAHAIVRRRAQRPFLRTLDLADTLASALPRRGRIHPATRIFQAIRIELNDELGALHDLLEQAPRFLNPGGRLVIISFHSLEDRIVKQTLARFSAEWLDRPEWPEPRRNPEHSVRLLTRKPVEPGPAEMDRNPRARSARLRAAERLPS